MNQNPTLSEREALEREINGILVTVMNETHALPMGQSHGPIQTKAREAIMKALGRRAPVAPAEPVAQFIADEEDGPAVGVLYDLPNGDQVWSGEVSEKLLSAQPEADILGPDNGSFVVHACKGDVRILAQAATPDIAMQLATAYVRSLATPAQPSTVTAAIPSELTGDAKGAAELAFLKAKNKASHLAVRDIWSAIVTNFPAPPAPSPVTPDLRRAAWDVFHGITPTDRDAASLLSALGTALEATPVPSPVTGALVERIKAVLKPFAEIADWYDKAEPDTFEVWSDYPHGLINRSVSHLGKFRAAADLLAALAAQKAEG